MKTYWFDALVLEPPLDAIPGLRMHVEVKHHHDAKTPDGRTRLCVGHEAVSADELERYVDGLKRELDAVVTEAKRRDQAYHSKLMRHSTRNAG